jgi:hypothetical protein
LNFKTLKSRNPGFYQINFQLEIVGDGYVVVSGLPKLNGLEHGNEICKMALELMHQVFKHKQRIRPITFGLGF